MFFYCSIDSIYKMFVYKVLWIFTVKCLQLFNKELYVYFVQTPFFLWIFKNFRTKSWTIILSRLKNFQARQVCAPCWALNPEREVPVQESTRSKVLSPSMNTGTCWENLYFFQVEETYIFWIGIHTQSEFFLKDDGFRGILPPLALEKLKCVFLYVVP